MKKGFSLLAISALMAACGGGGGETAALAPIATPAPTATPAPEVRLTADIVKIATRCDAVQADTNAQFVVHNADGSILATHVPDADGKIDIVWPEAAQHVSIITTVGESGAYRINSYVDVDDGDLGVLKEYDSQLNSDCACQTLQLDLSGVNSAYPNHSVSINGGMQQGDGAHTMQWCTVAGQSYPAIDIMLLPNSGELNAFGTLLTIAEGQTAYSLTAEDFAADSNAGFEAVIATNASDISRYRTFGNTALGRQFSLDGQSRQFVFPGQSSNNFVQAYRRVELGSNAQGVLIYQAIRRVKVDTNSATQTLVIAENEDALIAAIAGLADAFAEGGTFTYDVSNIGSQRNTVFGTLFGDGYQWRLDAPVSGTLPALRLPEAIETALAGRTATDMYIGVSGYQQAGGRAEFRRQLAAESRSGSKIRPAYFDNYDAEDIAVVFE